MSCFTRQQLLCEEHNFKLSHVAMELASKDLNHAHALPLKKKGNNMSQRSFWSTSLDFNVPQNSIKRDE